MSRPKSLDLTERHIERRGRRNAYAVDPDARLRHPTLGHVRLGRLIAALALDSEPVAAD